jgi:hypothetical protein
MLNTRVCENIDIQSTFACLLITCVCKTSAIQFTYLLHFYIAVLKCCQVMKRSATQDEFYEIRMNSARGIRPGVETQPYGNWKPKTHKPAKQHLVRAAEERNSGVPKMITAADYITWLSMNGPCSSSSGPEQGMIVSVAIGAQGIFFLLFFLFAHFVVVVAILLVG